jgi:hypothetical protein
LIFYLSSRSLTTANRLVDVVKITRRAGFLFALLANDLLQSHYSWSDQGRTTTVLAAHAVNYINIIPRVSFVIRTLIAEIGSRQNYLALFVND